jgi:hypothetical protein
MDGAWNISFQDDLFPSFLRIERRNGRQKGFCIGMSRRPKESLVFGYFYAL